jgi:hypothetical protein
MIFVVLKKRNLSWAQGLMAAILATQEADIWRLAV